MKFTSDSQGIHDSVWRSAYGGNIYKTNGSHGCVNTPLGAMRKIFKKAHVGTPVIVY
ncbi:MAG: L,D-transpeptidase [Prevotella sp.]|nr:L,D-transpeptidase [Prevotella sp.]